LPEVFPKNVAWVLCSGCWAGRQNLCPHPAAEPRHSELGDPQKTPGRALRATLLCAH